MTRHRLYHEEPKHVRDTLNHAFKVVQKVHQAENELIQLLFEIDQKRFYVRYGYNSLMGFCVNGLKFTRIQGRRIATLVRRQSNVDMASVPEVDRQTHRG